MNFLSLFIIESSDPSTPLKS